VFSIQVFSIQVFSTQVFSTQAFSTQAFSTQAFSTQAFSTKRFPRPRFPSGPATPLGHRRRRKTNAAAPGGYWPGAKNAMIITHTKHALCKS
jgi:hypothetical protein